MNSGCEMIEKGLCLGCTGLAEKDWVGKYKCSNYYMLKSMEKQKKGKNKYDNQTSITLSF